MKDYLFIVVSNREPYIHEYSGKKIKCVKAVSGLVIALDPVMQASRGMWIASGSGDADRDVVDRHNKIQVPPEKPAYTLKRIWLSKEEEDGYYYGYSNCGLWPLSHISYEKPVFNAGDWEYYKKVNRRFASSILEEIPRKKCFIWLQDYYLNCPHGGERYFWSAPNHILMAEVLEDEIGPERFWLTEDNQIAIAKFSREEVQSILDVGEIELTITGRLTDGTAFEGTDIVKVIDKTGKK